MRACFSLSLVAAVAVVSAVLNVHLAPHTHDDAGWLKTVDQYFYGAHPDIQDADVGLVLDATIAELARNPARKFTYVETEFFRRWWDNRPQFHELTRSLVASGQLSFAGGGAVMTDEANPVWTDMLDSQTSGHRWLLETFNVMPDTAWQIDPFGHGAFQGSVMSSMNMGFRSVHWARDDYQEFAQRSAARTNELFWAPSPSLGRSAGTFASTFAFYYYPSPGFNWCIGSTDPPVMDDPTMSDYNVPQRVEDFVNTALQQANITRGDDLLWTQGCDFSFANAAFQFGNMDKIIAAVNKDGRVHAQYSTPSLYASAKLASITLPEKDEDYMPLIDGPGTSVWSGYFTSRAALKGYIRETGALQQSARQLQVWAGGAADMGPGNPLYLLERAQAVAQHHDAVAGTSKQAVAFDYAQRLARGRAAADGAIADALRLLTGDAGVAWASCDLANATICPALAAGDNATLLAVYNSRGQAHAPLLRVPVPAAGAASYAVYGPGGAAVTAQLLPETPADAHLRSVYYNDSAAPAAQWLAWLAADLPAAGMAVYFLVPVAAAADAPHTHASVVTRMAGLGGGAGAADAVLSNGVLNVTIDGASGLVSGFAAPDTGAQPLTQALSFYNASDGNTDAHGSAQASGAYIFRPNSSTYYQVADLVPRAGGGYEPPAPGATPALAVTLVRGPVLSEARQVFSGWAVQTVRLAAGADDVVFEWTVGPIPCADGLGREVVARYAVAGWDTRATFLTDSNGRDALTRVRNERRAFNFTPVEPVASNYFPVTAFISVADASSGATLSVVTDRAQGGSSLADGALELMLQRRLQRDDDRGVGEPLNETGLTGAGLVVRGVHRLLLSGAARAGALRRGATAASLAPPIWRAGALAGGAAAIPAWRARHATAFSGLAAPLPPNVQLASLHSWGPGALLLRLAHAYAVGEDAALSANATVRIGALFATLRIADIVETTTSGNQPLAALAPVTYALDGGARITLPVVPPPPAGADLTITLAPMQIRTFIITPAAA